MRRAMFFAALAAVSGVVLFFPAHARAQQRASIVGVVQDSTGAVLPGVTVEAASPDLIEQAAAAITDSSGRYAIIDLRPGTYTVTFTLAGFQRGAARGHRARGRVRRAGERARCRSAALEETVTVTGASPVVDVQSTQNQSVLNRAGARRAAGRAHDAGRRGLVPGVSFYSQGFVSTMSVHGSATADQHIYFDGMNIGQNLTGTGSQANGVGVNELAQTELVYDAGSQSAENALGGVRMDSIPKEGGNTLLRRLRARSDRAARCRATTSPTSCGPFISAGHAARLQLRHQRGVRRADPAEQAVVPGRAARLADQQPRFRCRPQYFPQGGAGRNRAATSRRTRRFG